jgi:prepilin-type N-terminal cleavage/methylation domain-containing protein
MSVTPRGFTIVELLIVIVVIGILAAITVVAFSTVQNRSREAKISADLAILEKAVVAARIADNKMMSDITLNSATASTCVTKADGTDLATLPRTDSCWVNYASTLTRISNSSGINVQGLVDPWGRPYFVDENETAAACTLDAIGIFSQPFVTGWPSAERRVRINFFRPDC